MLDTGPPQNFVPGFRATLIRLLVGAHGVACDADGGLAAADEALGLGSTTLWEPEVRRLRAEFLASLRCPPAEIDAELTRASAVAARHGAVGLQLRIRHSRSRLLPAVG